MDLAEDLRYTNGTFNSIFEKPEGSRRVSLSPKKGGNLIDSSVSSSRGDAYLGKGYYATVYKVKEINSDRMVALKVMKSDLYRASLSRNPTHFKGPVADLKDCSEDHGLEILKMMRLESRKAFQLKKLQLGRLPIITYHHIWFEEFEENGMYTTFLFISMEAGEQDLEKFIDNRVEPIEFNDACRFLLHLTKCLIAIQKSGVATGHGDVKCDNLIVMDKELAFTDPRGILLTDFGVSKAMLYPKGDIGGLKKVFNKLSTKCEKLSQYCQTFSELEKLEEAKNFFLNLYKDDRLKKELFYLGDLKPLFDSMEERIGNLEKSDQEYKVRIGNLEAQIKMLIEENKKERQHQQQERQRQDERMTGTKRKREERQLEEDVEKEVEKMEPASKKRKV